MAQHVSSELSNDAIRHADPIWASNMDDAASVAAARFAQVTSWYFSLKPCSPMNILLIIIPFLFIQCSPYVRHGEGIAASGTAIWHIAGRLEQSHGFAAIVTFQAGECTHVIRNALV